MNDVINYNFKMATRLVTVLIVYMKKLLDSDWLRRPVQFKCNTNAKSVTSV